LGFCRSHDIDTSFVGRGCSGAQFEPAKALPVHARVALVKHRTGVSLSFWRSRVHNNVLISGIVIVYPCRSQNRADVWAMVHQGLDVQSGSLGRGDFWGLHTLQGVACHDYSAQCSYSVVSQIIQQPALGFSPGSLLKKLSTLCGRTFIRRVSVLFICTQFLVFQRYDGALF